MVFRFGLTIIVLFSSLNSGLADDTGKLLENILRGFSSWKPHRKSYRVKLEEIKNKEISNDIVVTFELDQVHKCRRIGKVEKLPRSWNKSLFNKSEECTNIIKK